MCVIYSKKIKTLLVTNEFLFYEDERIKNDFLFKVGLGVIRGLYLVAFDYAIDRFIFFPF